MTTAAEERNGASDVTRARENPPSRKPAEHYWGAAPRPAVTADQNMIGGVADAAEISAGQSVVAVVAVPAVAQDIRERAAGAGVNCQIRGKSAARRVDVHPLVDPRRHRVPHPAANAHPAAQSRVAIGGNARNVL